MRRNGTVYCNEVQQHTDSSLSQHYGIGRKSGGNCRVLLKICIYLFASSICKKAQRTKEKVEVLYILLWKQCETSYAKSA